MAGSSLHCVVCDKLLEGNQRHKCAEHEHVLMVVVDSESRPDPHRIGERWTRP